MKQMPITSVKDSKRWWTFSVISISQNDRPPTTHANGLIALSSDASPSHQRRNCLDKVYMEPQAPRIWYDKFTREGLNWGPEFAVMEEIFCDRARSYHTAVATTHFIRGIANELTEDPQYVVHPITIDSILQTAFVATINGWVKNLCAKVPVTMDSVHFSALRGFEMHADNPWSVDAISQRAGFGTVKIKAELFNSDDRVLLRMDNVRCVPY